MWNQMHGVLVCRYAPLSIDFPSAVAALRQLAMKVHAHVAKHLTELTLCLRIFVRPYKPADCMLRSAVTAAPDPSSCCQIGQAAAACGANGCHRWGAVS
jgi:hypothetical protein